MKIQVALFSTVVAMLLCGCTPPNFTHSPMSNKTHLAKSTAVDPVLYLQCQSIYNKVTEGIKNNTAISVDSQLSSIEQKGDSSASGTPNHILYEDAATVVALEHGFEGDGTPARAYDALKHALAQLKSDLDKYRQQTSQ